MSMKLKKSKFFYSIFIPMVVIGLLLVVGAAGWIYHSTRSTIYGNIVQERENETVNIRNHVEQVVKTVEYSLTAYSSSENFKNVIEQPLDYKNFDRVRTVSRELSYLESISGTNLYFRLISLQKGWQIATDSSLTTVDAAQIANYQQLVQQKQDYLFWQPNGHDIQMIVSLPVYKQTRDAIAIATIQGNFIDSFLQEKDNVLIFDKNDHSLLYQKQDGDASELMKTAFDLKGKSGYFTIGNQLFTYTTSTYNSWIYVMPLDAKRLSSALLPVNASFFLLTLLMGMMIIVASYWLAERSVKPLRFIRQRLTSSQNDGAVSEKVMEVSEIYYGIDRILQENGVLNSTLQVQRSALETLFMLDLFRRQISKKDIPTKLAQFGYPLMEECSFAVCLLTIDDFGTHTVDEKEILLLTMAKFMEDVVPSRHRMTPVVMDTNTQATIFTFEAAEEQILPQITAYCETVQKIVKEYLQIEVSCGISQVYGALEDSYKAEQQAREALHFRMNLGNAVVISYDDIARQMDARAIVSYAKVDTLLEAIRTANREMVDRELPITIQQIFSENHTPMSIEMALFQMVNEVIQLGQLLGVNSHLAAKGGSLYTKLMKMDHPVAIQHYMMQVLIDPILENIHLRTNQELHSLSEKMVHIIHQYYDQDLSLEMVADMLHYNPNYLSSVFKKEQEINFGEYVLNYRLSIAKRWLEETSMTVKEIAERLQYTNTQNFIRFFKKKEGCTPGEYRKEHQTV